MNPMSPDELVAAMEWRYAVNVFDTSKKIPAETWKSLERSLLLTASSHGLQPWRFVVVEDARVKEKLRAASWNQRQVTECSHFVVFQYLTTVTEEYVDDYLKLMAETRGIPFDALAKLRKSIFNDIVHGPRSAHLKEWAVNQVYLALGNLLTSAAVLGVDACPMEGLMPEEYDKILALEGPYKTVVACAAGYRSAEDKRAAAKKIRFGSERMFRRF